MSIKAEWYETYRRQRMYRGRAVVVSRETIVTEAIRKVMPPVQHVVHTRMNSGRSASYTRLLPPQ
jgi:hypothetical protein